MKIVIIGGTGLIGSKVVRRLRAKGHEVVAASPSTGVDTITGKGLAGTLKGARVVVDVANSPSFEDRAVMDFFETSGRNLVAAESAAGVGHHVALSVVGTERLQASGYCRGKLAQETLTKASGIPYTIVRSTQFFEFLDSIVDLSTVGRQVRLAPVAVQPISSDDVADVMAETALGAPLNGTIEIAGPERVRLTDLVGRFVHSATDVREVVADPEALYFGAELNDLSLVPGDGARLGTIGFETWRDRISVRN